MPKRVLLRPRQILHFSILIIHHLKGTLFFIKHNTTDHRYLLFYFDLKVLFLFHRHRIFSLGLVCRICIFSIIYLI